MKGSSDETERISGDPGDVIRDAGTISILKNTLNQGVSYHLKLAYPDSFGFLLQRNTYRHGSTNVNVFLDAAGSPVHVVP